LFTLASDGVTFQPNPNSGMHPEHLDYFKFVGKIIAKAICDGQLLDVHFTKSFYKHILGLPVSFNDLETIDPSFYKSLKSLLVYSLEDLGVELTFSTTLKNFDENIQIELIENGSNIAVNDKNKHEYVKLLAHHYLSSSFRNQVLLFLFYFFLNLMLKKSLFILNILYGFLCILCFILF
jgi:E3 ubiquitin-protein ligase HUWE1